MKRLLLLLVLLVAPAMLRASATTSTVWSNGDYVYAKTVKSVASEMPIHSMRATARLKKAGSYVSQVSSSWVYNGTASITTSMGFDEGIWGNDGIGEVYCPKGVYTSTQYNAVTATEGSSFLCLLKNSWTLTAVSPSICTLGYWETATYVATPGCAAVCASVVTMTVAVCAPAPINYKIVKHWEYKNGSYQCFGKAYLVTPQACDLTHCYDVIM